MSISITKRIVGIVYRAVRNYGAHDGPFMAAAIAYYGFFSLFPLLLLLVAAAGYVLPRLALEEQLVRLTSLYLPGSVPFIEENLRHIIGFRERLGIIALVVLYWSASGVFMAISRSLNLVWEGSSPRSALERRVIALGIVAVMGLLFILSVASSTFFRLVGSLSLDPSGRTLSQFFAWRLTGNLLPFMFTFLTFLFAYRFIPDKENTLRMVWPGALLAAGALELAKNIFVWYVANLSAARLVYGSVGTVIVLLFWIYLGASILLLGAELASEYERSWLGRT